MAIGGHHNPVSQTNEWFTPPFIIEALGGAGTFDLDPATHADAPLRTALARYTREDNGLLKPWFGRIWLNPPYSNPEVGAFMARMAEHDRGMALIFARTETQMFFQTVWARASAVLFLEGRLNFHRLDGRRATANAGAPSVICAYGADDMDILAACRLDGQFVPLRLPRGVVIAALEPSWRQAIGGWLREQTGPVKLDESVSPVCPSPQGGAESELAGQGPADCAAGGRAHRARRMGGGVRHDISERRSPLHVMAICSCGWSARERRRQNALARAAKLRSAVRQHIEASTCNLCDDPDCDGDHPG